MQTLPLSPPKTKKTSRSKHSAPIPKSKKLTPQRSPKQQKKSHAKQKTHTQQAPNAKERINAEEYTAIASNSNTSTTLAMAKTLPKDRNDNKNNTLIQHPTDPKAAEELDRATAKYYTSKHWVLASRARSPTLSKSAVLEDLAMLTVHQCENYPFYLRLREVKDTLQTARNQAYGQGALVNLQKVLRQAYRHYYVPLDTALALIEWTCFDGLPAEYTDEVTVYTDHGSLPVNDTVG